MKSKKTFINFKTMDKGVNVIQLETASGAAIQSFEGAQGIYLQRCKLIDSGG